LELWDAVCKLALACGCKLPFARGEGTGHAVGAKVWTGNDLINRRVLPYLAKCDPGISRCGGHDDTYWAARAVCWGFALGEDQGFAVLWDHFNDRCQPPWSEAELRHKCHNAATLPFDKPWGWLLDQPPPQRNGAHQPRPTGPCDPGGPPASFSNFRTEEV